jgi:hypothetical protein
MALGIYEEEDIRAIAKSIRNGIGEEIKYTTKQMPDKINEMQVYAYNNGRIEGYGEGRNEGYSMGRADGITEGKQIGYAEGKTDGIAEGKKSQYDEFWDSFQDNGERTDYEMTFRKSGWNDITFNPKHNMRPKNATSMFQGCAIVDLEGILSRNGVVLDFSQCTKTRMALYWCTVLETVPVIDTTATLDDSSSGDLYYLFGASEKLKSIRKLILKQSGNQFLTGLFSGCVCLEEVYIEGVIGQNLDLSSAWNLIPLSAKSVLLHLKDYSNTDDAFTRSIKFPNRCWERLEADSLSPNGNSWREYAADLGWLT